MEVDELDAARRTPDGDARWFTAFVRPHWVAINHHRSMSDTAELDDRADSDGTVELATSLDVARGLARLSPRQQLAVALHYYVGLPVVESAEVMGCSPGTVKSTLSDARRALHTILGEEYR